MPDGGVRTVLHLHLLVLAVVNERPALCVGRRVAGRIEAVADEFVGHGIYLRIADCFCTAGRQRRRIYRVEATISISIIAEGLLPTGLIRDRFGRLFELVKNSPSLNELERYEPYLKKDYASEIALLYGEAIIRYAIKNVGRQHYQTIARYL